MATHSPLLAQYLETLRAVAAGEPVLDLACGRGRNGLYLQAQGLPVVFADRDPQALAEVAQQLDKCAGSAELWHVDLEQDAGNPLAGRSFGAILVFRYLHRPLFGALRDAVAPGGMLVYETFTEAQAGLGRPKNPDFLLRSGELAQHFADWDRLHSFEGISHNDAGQPVAIAQLVARKPTG